MNNRFFTKAAAAAMSLVMSTLSMPFSVYASDHQIMNQTSDGYDYEFWNMNSAGDTKIVTGEDGAFSCAWDDIENVLFRTGRKLGSVQSWQDYDDIKYEYEYQGKPYWSDQYDFMEGSSSGYDGKAKVVDQYRNMSEPFCFVDPSRPSRAVLNRDLHWGYLFTLFPLPFLAIGLYIMFISLFRPDKIIRACPQL